MEQVTFSAKNRQNQLILHIKQFRILFAKFGAAHLSAWMIHNRATYPGFIYQAGKLAVGIVLATIAMHMVGTGYGVITEDVVMQAGVSILLIIFLSACLIIARAIYLSFFHVVGTWNENRPDDGPKLLSAPTWTPPDISPDILVAAFDEKEVFEKAEKAESLTTHATWAVIIPPFKNQAAILTAEKETDYFFDRGSEPFAGMVPAELTLPSGLDHVHEDEAAYRRYVEWFCITYRQWRDGAKLEANKGRARKTIFEVMEAHAKAVSAALCFLIFCLPAFGQESKTRQVDEALGTRIREIPKAGDKITFIFQEGSREKYERRTGDGVSEYTALLQRTTGLMQYDDQGGRLVAVTKNGEVIARGPEIELVNTKPEGSRDDQMRPMWAREEASEPGYMSMPDSITSAAMFEGWKESIREAEDRTGRAAKPAFDFSWWFFGEIFVALFVLASVLWFFAKTASEEGIIGVWGETIFISAFLVTVHQNCSALLMCVLWIAESFIFIKGAHLLITGPMPIFISCLIWLGGIWLMRKTHNKIVPNIKGLAGAGRNMNRGINPYNVS